MQHISFEALFNKAMKLKQVGIKWHFHMIGPACIFSRSKEQYELFETIGGKMTGCVSQTMVGEVLGGDL